MRLCAFVFGGPGGFRPQREGGRDGRLFQSTGSGEVRSFRARREGRAHQSYDLPQKLSIAFPSFTRIDPKHRNGVVRFSRARTLGT